MDTQPGALLDASVGPDPSTPARPSIRRAVVYVVALLIVLLVVGGLVQVVTSLAGVGQPPQWLVVTLVNTVAFGAVLAVGQRLERVPFSDVAPLRPVGPGLLLALVPLGLGLSVLLSEVDNLFRVVLPMPGVLAEVFSKLIEESPLGGLVALAIVAPATEELFFRGFLLRGFLGRHRTRTALIASAALFAFGHGNPWQFTSALVLGLVLGWLYWRTRSIVPCLVGHSFYNGLVVPATVLLPPIPGYTADPFGPDRFQPLWFDAFGVVMVVLGVFLLYRATRRPAP